MSEMVGWGGDGWESWCRLLTRACSKATVYMLVHLGSTVALVEEDGTRWYSGEVSFSAW